MVDSEKKVLLAQETKLTPTVWHRCLTTAGLIHPGGQWSHTAIANGISFDLRRIEWLEFSAGAQLVLLAQAAAQEGIAVEVHLPEGNNASDSTPAARRHRAFEFLHYLCLPEAISHDPRLRSWVAPTIMYRGNAHHATTLPEDARRSYLKIVPYVWIDHRDTESHARFVRFFAKAVGYAGIGLAESDARGIANVVVHELVENAFRHSAGSGLALVSAFARGASTVFSPTEHPEQEHRFIERCTGQGDAVVEIFVGDTGNGLISKLRPVYVASHRESERIPVDTTHAKIANWAFDRWSSSDISDIGTRGVRGLYRVDRLVARYAGLIRMSTHRIVHYRDHTRYAAMEMYNVPGELPFAPGTSLTVRLAVSTKREFQGPRFAIDDRARATASLQELIILPALVPKSGIADEEQRRFSLRMASIDRRQPRTVYVVFDGGVYEKQAVETALMKIARIAAPHLVVLLGLPGTDDELHSSTTSVSAIAATNKTTDTVYALDPLLVVSDRGRYFWLGVNEIEAEILEVVRREIRIDVDALCKTVPASDEQWNEFGRLCREHPVILRPSEPLNGKRDFELAVDLADFIQLARESVARPIRDAPRPPGDASPRENPTGISKGTFQTPALKFVDCWIDLNRYLTRENANLPRRAVIFALAELVRRAGLCTASEFVLLFDASATPEMGEQLAHCIGCTRDPVRVQNQTIDDDDAESRHDHGVQAVVFADLVASMETVKRTVVYAMRQGYEVKAVVCLLDTRASPNNVSDTTVEPIVAWGIEVPVLALAKFPTEISAPPDYVIKSPLGDNEAFHRGSQAETDKRGDDRDKDTHHLSPIHDAIKRTDAFERRHTARLNGRHLTFKIDPVRLMADAIVRAELRTKIEAWRAAADSTSKSANNLTVLVPKDRHDGALWFEAVTEFFGSLWPGSRPKVTPVSRHGSYQSTIFARHSYGEVRNRDVIVFDWGLITGDTIARLSRGAVESGAHRVLGLALLSQMSLDDEAFIKCVTELTAEVIESPDDFFEAPKRTVNRASIRFDWLGSAYFGHYPANLCPICRQRSEVRSAPTTLSSIQAYRKKEIARLEPDTVSDPLAVDSALLSRYRRYVIASNESTLCRVKLVRDINVVHRELQKGSSRHAAFTLLAFLSDEPHWLKRAPLHFSETRGHLAEIFTVLAADDGLPGLTRIHAVRALRRTSKLLYIDKFPMLIGHALEHPEILVALTEGIVSILQRSYHERANLVTKIYTATCKAIDIADSTSTLGGYPQLRVMLVYLRKACTYLLERVEQRDLDERGAYRKLLRRLTDEFSGHDDATVAASHLAYEAAHKAIRSILAEEEADLTQQQKNLADDWLRQCRSLWQTCESKIERKLMPLLEKIRPILDIDSSDEFDRLRELVDRYRDKAYPPPLALTRALDVIGSCRNALELRAEEPRVAWRIVPSDIEFYQSTFFHPNARGKLYTFIAEAPAGIAHIYEQELARSKNRLGENLNDRSSRKIESNIQVFVHINILVQIFYSVFHNLEKHWDRESSKINFHMKFSIANGVIMLCLANDGTRMVSHHIEQREHALLRYDSQLQLFGGSIRGREPTPADFFETPFAPSFVVEIRLRLWEN